MKKKDFQTFAAEYLIPQMSGFVAKGNLVYRVPVGVVFTGFIFDSSGFDEESFNPDAFVQPLYVPLEHFAMTLGERLRGVWKLRDKGDSSLADALLSRMKEQGWPLFEALGTPEGMARDVEKLKSPKNHYVRQAAAYSSIWIGNHSEASRRLDELLEMLNEMSASQKWASDVHTEVTALKEVLTKNPEAARSLLVQWAEETRRKLDLPA